MKDKPQYEKVFTPRIAKKAELLIGIWNEHDSRNLKDLEGLVNRLLFLSGVPNSKESAKCIARAYKIHSEWDDNPKRSIKIKSFGYLSSIWLDIENEFKKALKVMGVTYYNKSAYHHACWWMYYSASNLFKGDRIAVKLKRYLCYFFALWHIFSEHRIETKSYIGAIRCTYLLFKGAKYAHSHKQHQLGGEYLERYWYISQKYNHPIYMF